MNFSFATFKVVSGIADAEEVKYSLVLRSIFELLSLQYEIDIDTLDPIPFLLQNAIYEHAVFLYKLDSKGLNLISSVTDSAGNKTSYRVTVPKDILSVYKMVSPSLPALL